MELWLKYKILKNHKLAKCIKKAKKNSKGVCMYVCKYSPAWVLLYV